MQLFKGQPRLRYLLKRISPVSASRNTNPARHRADVPLFTQRQQLVFLGVITFTFVLLITIGASIA